MRKIVIFTMIVTLIFATAGCTPHREPDKKAVESTSTNAVIDTTQAEKLSEKTENETVEKSTFAEETTHRLTLKLILKRCPKSRLFLKSQQQMLIQSKILKGKKKRQKAEYQRLKLQQMLFRKSQQQLNKLKNLIYPIGFLTLKIMLKALV